MVQVAERDTAEGIAFAKPTKADRARLSGPAIRTFKNLADKWELSEQQRLALLGEPGRSTYYGWVSKAQAQQTFALPLDTLFRLSAIFGVNKALRIVFARNGAEIAWLKAPNAGPYFNGRAPLDVMTAGSPDAILDVRRYLDAWRGGQAAAPVASGGAFERAPVDDADIVFL